MHVSNMIKLLLILVAFTAMKRYIMERIPKNVENVGKPSLSSVSFNIMKGITVERNHMNLNKLHKCFSKLF